MSTSTTTSTASYTVTGMTCGHCVSTIESAVGKVPGVSNVAVDLASGVVTVTSEGPVADTEVRASVVDAGFEITPLSVDPAPAEPAAGATCCGGGCH